MIVHWYKAGTVTDPRGGVRAVTGWVHLDNHGQLIYPAVSKPEAVSQCCAPGDTAQFHYNTHAIDAAREAQANPVPVGARAHRPGDAPFKRANHADRN